MDDGNNGTNEVHERYVNDGGDVALVLDGTNANAVEHRYLHGGGTDQVLGEETATGNVRWLLADHQGSVRDVADSSGTVLNHVIYDGFGNVFSQSSATVGLRFGYTGRKLDGESGLWHYRRRYYGFVGERAGA